MRPVLLLLALLAALLAAGAQARALVGDRELIGWKGESFVRSAELNKSGAWVETLSWKPRAFLIHGLLTDDECDHLIGLAKPHMVKSMVVDNTDGASKASEVRTSSGHFLQRGQDEVVKRIEDRIGLYTQIPPAHGEALHILNYAVGQKYDAHFDYFHDAVNTRNGGQRLATMLMYLSTVEEGGETVFPNSEARPKNSGLSSCGKQGVAVKPFKGDALLFYSLTPNGTLDTSSLHSGCPVIKGAKWSATKWIRQTEYKS